MSKSDPSGAAGEPSGSSAGDSAKKPETPAADSNTSDTQSEKKNSGAAGSSDANSSNQPSEHNDRDRRQFLGRAAAGMAVGLGAGYGTFAYMGAKFLFPPKTDNTIWQFVSRADEIDVGSAINFSTPDGQNVVIARQSDGLDAETDFIALSSVCPHLGCAVHWEEPNERFFCPCHNGAFDRQGKPTEGPVAAANQTLTRFGLKVERGLLYIAVPQQSKLAGNSHDPQEGQRA